jgi:hypothetical protein
MPKTKLSALLSLILVFLSGTLVGAVSYRLYMVNTVVSTASARPPRMDPEEVRKRRVSEMRDRVKLDDEQVGKLNAIYDRTRQDFDDLHKKGSQESRVIWDKQRAEVRAILRSEQLPLYEQYQKDMDEQRKRHQQMEGKK